MGIALGLLLSQTAGLDTFCPPPAHLANSRIRHTLHSWVRRIHLFNGAQGHFALQKGTVRRFFSGVLPATSKLWPAVRIKSTVHISPFERCLCHNTFTVTASVVTHRPARCLVCMSHSIRHIYSLKRMDRSTLHASLGSGSSSSNIRTLGDK